RRCSADAIARPIVLNRAIVRLKGQASAAVAAFRALDRSGTPASTTCGANATMRPKELPSLGPVQVVAGEDQTPVAFPRYTCAHPAVLPAPASPVAVTPPAFAPITMSA